MRILVSKWKWEEQDFFVAAQSDSEGLVLDDLEFLDDGRFWPQGTRLGLHS